MRTLELKAYSVSVYIPHSPSLMSFPGTLLACRGRPTLCDTNPSWPPQWLPQFNLIPGQLWWIQTLFLIHLWTENQEWVEYMINGWSQSSKLSADKPNWSTHDLDDPYTWCTACLCQLRCTCTMDTNDPPTEDTKESTPPTH